MQAGAFGGAGGLGDLLRQAGGALQGQRPQSELPNTGQAASSGNMATGLGGLAGQMGGFGGGMAAGGPLGVLLGSKKVRKVAGGALGYGGMAVLGVLAYRAYQNWQQGQQPSPPADLPVRPLPARSRCSRIRRRTASPSRLRYLRHDRGVECGRPYRCVRTEDDFRCCRARRPRQR